MEDTVIINLYFDRSEKAIQATEEKYSRYCFSIAWNVLYDKEDSDECVNDTWLATWNSIPPRKPAILSAFLGKITRNLAIDCFRRKKAAKRSTEHILELCKELEEIEDVTAYSLNDEIQRKEILEILEKFLESLKKGDCDIFIRRYWYMDSISEISARHGISESRIKSSLYRSRKKLWERVKHLYGKGFKTLELIGDLDDKYIYEASKPWKKQHRFFHIQRSWKTAVAGIILLIMVGCTLRYQEDVKAALQRVTSWIGQALGIKNGDTDSYTNVVGKSISRDGITITLNEIVMDSKNLWIAYSDSEDSDADMKDAVEDKLLYTEVCINGQEIQQGLGQRTVNAFSENPITVEDFTIGEEVNTEGTVNIEFKVWPIAMDDADTWENVQKIQADTEPYTFKLATSKEELEKNTVDLNLNQNIKMDSNVLNLTEFRWNPFESTIYGMYHGTVYIDSDYYLIGTDDQGNKICYQETGRNGQETMFRQTIGLYPGYEEISPEANTITLQLYEVKNDTAHQVSEEKMDKDSSDDIYEEFTVYVYNEGESPTDDAIPIGDKFTVQIR